MNQVFQMDELFCPKSGSSNILSLISIESDNNTLRIYTILIRCILIVNSPNDIIHSKVDIFIRYQFG
jgi:hypothetical protein